MEKKNDIPTEIVGNDLASELRKLADNYLGLPWCCEIYLADEGTGSLTSSHR